MNIESNPHPFTTTSLYLDGLGGQEDELEDVQKGKLDPPTDDEPAGSILEKNNKGRALETEDEDEPTVNETDERPYGERHPV